MSLKQTLKKLPNKQVVAGLVALLVPGGGIVVGSLLLYDAIKRRSDKKPKREQKDEK